jgi:fibronectin-binding autotransporter adhesin
MHITGITFRVRRPRPARLALRAGGALAFGALAVGALAAGALTAAPALAAPTAAPACSGTSFTWTGMGDETSWSDATNWSPSGVPGSCAADSVDIPIEANITGAPAITLQNFTIDSTAGSDGTLTGGPLTVSGTFEWDGSSLETTVNLPAGSTGTIAGPANFKGLGGGGLGVPGTLNVSGTLNFSNLSGNGGDLNLGAGIGQGLIDVMPGGTLTAAGENDLAGVSCCGGTQNPTLENHGTIDVTSGRTLTGAVVMDQAGHVTAAAGAVLDADAPVTLANSSSYSGAGELLLDLSASPATISGTLSLGTGFHLDLGPQACLQGSGTITGPGSFDFTGGDLAAGLTIAKGAVMHVTGPGGKDLRAFSCGTADGKVTNKGKILVDQGSLSLGGTGTITNDPGATFAIAPGATVTTDSCCGPNKLLFNKGTLQVTAPPSGVPSGTPASIDPVPLDNSGTISVARGQKLVVTDAPTTFESGTTVTGSGGTTVVQAPVTLGTTLTIGTRSALDLDQNGSLDGVTSIGGSGTLRWTGGAISGTVGVASTVPVSISGAVQHAVTNRPDGTASVLTTSGPVSVGTGTAKAPDSVQIGGGDQWVNAGTLTLPKNATLGSPSCCGATPGLKNTGTVTLSVGGAQDTMTTSFLNAGTVKLASGTLAMTTGSYQQQSAGTLAVTFAGTSPGTGFGRLDVSGAVTLAGTLNVGTSGGFRPPTGTPFGVLAYGSRSGKFSATTGSPPYTVAYHATGMDVVFG